MVVIAKRNETNSDVDNVVSCGASPSTIASMDSYLRARYYDPNVGRFNRLDPFAGNADDPQSLHKYAYVHGDPINGIDPSGEYLESLLREIGHYALFQQVSLSDSHNGRVIESGGREIRTAVFDNFQNGRFANVTIEVDSNGIPRSFDADKVQQAIQLVLNKAKLPIVVNVDVVAQAREWPKSSFSPVVDLRKYDKGGSVAATRGSLHSVFWRPVKPFGKQAVAYSPSRTKHTIDPNFGPRDARQRGIKYQTFYANTLLHEVFYLGIVGGIDKKRGGTAFSSITGGRSLMTLEPSDVKAILKAIGPLQ